VKIFPPITFDEVDRSIGYLFYLKCNTNFQFVKNILF
jgi:hypothetical protein